VPSTHAVFEVFANYSNVCVPEAGCHSSFGSELDVRWRASTDDVMYLGDVPSTDACREACSLTESCTAFTWHSAQYSGNASWANG
jgi:hypothetical protein